MLFFVNFLFTLTFFTHTVKNNSVSNNIRRVTYVVTVGLIMATAFCQIMSKIYYIIYKLSWNLEQNVRHEILFAWWLKILNRWKSGTETVKIRLHTVKTNITGPTKAQIVSVFTLSQQWSSALYLSMDITRVTPTTRTGTPENRLIAEQLHIK